MNPLHSCQAENEVVGATFLAAIPTELTSHHKSMRPAFFATTNACATSAQVINQLIYVVGPQARTGWVNRTMHLFAGLKRRKWSNVLSGGRGQVSGEIHLSTQPIAATQQARPNCKQSPSSVAPLPPHTHSPLQQPHTHLPAAAPLHPHGTWPTSSHIKFQG